jgi:hypothetical protein
MRDAGMPDVARKTFAHYYKRLREGDAGMLPEYRAVDRAFQRLFQVDARRLYGFVVPVLAVSGLVVLLALDPSNWLLALAVLLLLAASLIVVLGIVRMLSEDDAAG